MKREGKVNHCKAWDENGGGKPKATPKSTSTTRQSIRYLVMHKVVAQPAALLPEEGNEEGANNNAAPRAGRGDNEPGANGPQSKGRENFEGVVCSTGGVVPQPQQAGARAVSHNEPRAAPKKKQNTNWHITSLCASQACKCALAGAGSHAQRATPCGQRGGGRQCKTAP